VISYKQPVTGPEINEIRGVNCAGVLQTLLEKRLITTAGRKQVIGRPILYRTSKEFMMRFGLSDLDELPSLKEFEQLAQAALGSDSGIAPMEPELTGEPYEARGSAEPPEGAETQPSAGTGGEPAATPAVANAEASPSDSGEQTAEAQSTSENTMSAAAGAGGTHEASNVVSREEESQPPAEKVTLSEEGPALPPSS